MTNDAYWDELGIAWVAFDPGLSTLPRALEDRARRESRLFRAGFIMTAALSAAALFLGVWTTWLGLSVGPWNFATRGVAIIIIALLIAMAARAFWWAGASNDACPAGEMMDLTIARARRLLLTIRLSLCACTVAAAFGLFGSAVRAHLSRPPNMSPVVDLSLLALAAVSLGLYGHRVKAELAKFEYLRQVLTAF